MTRWLIALVVMASLLGCCVSMVWAQSQPPNQSGNILNETTLIPVGSLVTAVTVVYWATRKITQFEDRLNQGDSTFRRLEKSQESLHHKLDRLPCRQARNTDPDCSEFNEDHP